MTIQTKHYDREKLRAQRERQARRARGEVISRAQVGRGPGTHTQRFLGIDGEGGNVNGRHEYTLLVAAGKNYRNTIHNDGQPLTTIQCLDFILALPQVRKLVSFYFDYDVTMMLRDIDPETLGRIVKNEERRDRRGRSIPVTWEGYALTWIPGKIFKVGRADGKASDVRTIYDTSGFFQCSFARALEGWSVGRQDERDFIVRMKEARGDFTGEITPEIIAYSVKECEFLCRLMDLVYRETEGQGFHLRTFSGAGSLANAMLEKWDIAARLKPLPPEVEDAASHAYFGGRFEAAAIGEIQGPIYEYDINSAYPHAMQTLPCLACGEWTHEAAPDGVRKLADNELALWRISWDFDYQEPPYADWFPLPWRSQTGSICFPGDGEGWYWQPELDAAIEAGYGGRIYLLEVHRYHTDCEHRPFSHIPDLYARRQALKAEGHQGEKVLKLGLNSLYGKTAQQVGRRKYASLVWAGMITSRTRAMLMDACNHFNNERMPLVVMTATDAVYSRAPLPLQLGNGLGEWEAHVHDDILIVQPGLYALNITRDDAIVRKTRGIRKTSFSVNDVLARWRAEGMLAKFEVPVTAFIGLKRGLVSNEYSIGSWIQEKRRLGFWPRIKRFPIVVPNKDGVCYLSSIHTTHAREASYRYDKAVLSPETILYRLVMADDSATPDFEWIPGYIMGFEHSDFK